MGLALLLVLPLPAVAADKPNIIVILADDLGYADLGCQGCKDIPTPNIDSIAAGGVRFTDGYATHPVCSPSRAGLVSGKYQHRFGFEHNSGPERYASPEFGVPRDVPTLAERLNAAGYATGMVGKWHIGFKQGLRPHERGFDFYYGFLSGARSYYPNSPREWDPIICNGTPVTDEKEYLTDAFARESVRFIDRRKEGPFFLYLAFNAVHTPLEATKAYEARFPHITDRKRKTYAGMTAAWTTPWATCSSDYANVNWKRRPWSSSTATTAAQPGKRRHAMTRCAASKGRCSKAESVCRSSCSGKGHCRPARSIAKWSWALTSMRPHWQQRD